MLAMFDRRLDGLLDRGVQEVSWQIALRSEVRLNDCATESLAYEFRQQHGIARDVAGFAQSFQDCHGVSN
jgi:hypothetical protein